MNFHRMGSTALVTYLVTILSVDLGLPISAENLFFQKVPDSAQAFNWQLSEKPKSTMPNWWALSQISDLRKAEADELLQKGNEQLNANQYEAAKQSFEQALAIYREIKDRAGEGQALKNLGNTYYSLENYAKAIEYAQGALDVARGISDRDLETRALLNLGLAEREQGNLVNAIAHYQQSLEIAHSLANREVEWKALYNLGIAYRDQKEYKTAIASFEQSLQVIRAISNPQFEAVILIHLGLTYSDSGNYTQAIDAYQRSWAIAQRINNSILISNLAAGLGSAYEATGNYQKSLEFYQLWLTTAQQLQDAETAAVAQESVQRVERLLKNPPPSPTSVLPLDSRTAAAERFLQQGFNQSKNGQAEAALESFQQALAIAKEISDLNRQWQALIQISNIYEQIGNYPLALEFGQQSLDVAWKQEIGVISLSFQSQSLLSLGAAYTALQQTTKAIESLQQALTISQQLKTNESPEVANLAVETEQLALAQLSIAYQLSGNFRQALEYSQQELAIANSLNDTQKQGQILHEIGDIYLGLNDPFQGLDYFQQSLTIARSTNNPILEVQSLRSIGLLYMRWGDFDKSVEYGKQSLTIAQKLNNYATGQNLSRLEKRFIRVLEGEALSLVGSAYLLTLTNLNQGIEYFQQYLSLARSLQDEADESGALSNLGMAYLIQENYGKAIDYFNDSLAVLRKSNNSKFASINRQQEGNILGYLARTYAALGDNQKALAYARENLGIAESSQDTTDKATALAILGNTLFWAGEFPEAEKTLRDSIQEFEVERSKFRVEDTRKVSFFDLYSDNYDTLQQVLIAQNRTSAALEVAEQSRARAFVELLSARLSTNSVTTILPLTCEQIQQIAKEQNATLVEYSIIYDKITLPVRVAGKQPNLESELLIWVVKPTGEVAFRRVNLKQLRQQNKSSLAQLVAISRQAIGVRGRSLYTEFEPTPDQSDRLKQLHKLLIEPIAQYLPTNPSDRVIFIPQNQLLLLPFPALQDNGGKYLIEKHTILTAPSIQLLQLTHKKRPAVSGDGMLIVGNPTMPSVMTKLGESSQQLSSLPGAEKEATAIAQLFNTQAITGKQATKAAILPKLSNARIIHLATHGLLDDFQGLGVPGAIALAPDGTGKLNDGLLTANEILDLNLNAELAVLSACDTGRGKITGDGVIGLSRSLITAGVPSVIVSLWSVPDAPTASLMTQFYQNLQNNPDKAQALRQAMLTTMATHPNPKDWAAFTLIGEAQ
ncbi:MAG TPA: Fis family transcriptional regulator [Cyanobacteria bacterium UBA8803]|nr:Fis family transcriptional regulator [Cyanobacteria bacterium UBA9273]HBL62539.1 Fis family transcriptional regulator [Cyanobacteria bacterium UBA8803]